MAWRDQLRPAKLGNASFFVDASDATLGRNTQTHEYPLRDKPSVEDLGRKARRFTLDCYVIGEQYMSDRDLLIAELESFGPKTLVHPYMGEMKVNVVDAQGPRESTKEGGLARFSITVVESGTVLLLSEVQVTAKRVQDTSAISTLSASTVFAQKYKTKNALAFILDAATAQVQGISTTLRGIIAKVTTVPSAVSTFVAALTDLSGAASSLILVPQTLASRITSLINQTRDIVNQPIFALNIVRELFHYGDDLPYVPLTTTNRIIQATNQSALCGLVQQAAVIAACHISSTIEFDSQQDALAVRDELIEVIDAQLEQSTTDEEYSALVDVRTAMAIDLETRGARLAQLLNVTLLESAPAVALAYERYADPLRDAEIISRNAVRDPMFLPSGRPLQVLSDA